MDKRKTNTTFGASPTLLSVYDHDLRLLQQHVGIDRANSTYVRQLRLRTYVADFIKECYHADDLPLADLTAGFIRDFATWLSTARHYRGGTIWLACQQLKSVVSRAFQRGLLPCNPFYAFRIGRNIRPRQYLTEDELRRLISTPLPQPQQAYFRDLFVFSALTGMAFADICRLRPTDVCEISGQQWVMAKRHKTRTPFQVRLLPLASTILQRYGQGGTYVFNAITYRTLAKHIPVIIRACGINKHITFHCARHTFAVMSLNAGVPIESISRMLGHADITTTQIYAKITIGKLAHDIDRLDLFVSSVCK